VNNVVFGLSANQKDILMYLYSLRDSPESPPDSRLEIGSIAENLQMKQKEVREEIEGLCKKLFARHFTSEGHGYCRIMPRGIREVEKMNETESEWHIGTEGADYRRRRRET
jgi:hypothetical protein